MSNRIYLAKRNSFSKQLFCVKVDCQTHPAEIASIYSSFSSHPLLGILHSLLQFLVS